MMARRGAEADLARTTWLGRPAVLKDRRPKAYRHPELDGRIRRQRTVREAESLALAKSFGVPAPLVYHVDARRCRIVMQRLPGTPVQRLGDAELVRCCYQMGRAAALLHANGMVHGDLTTSNFVLCRGRVFALDFGLSARSVRPEDHAVDLRLFKEILGSAHAPIMERAWRRFVSGYRKTAGPERTERALRLVADIEARGRYAEVV